MTEQDFLKHMNYRNPPRNAVFKEGRAFPGNKPCWGYVCKDYSFLNVTSFLTEDGAECDQLVCTMGCDHSREPYTVN